MKIVITGSSSGIGKHLVRTCLAVGHEVIEFAGSSSSYWRLGDSFPQDLHADVLIHLAHDRKMGLKKHSDANLKLAESFNGYKIYLSSFSAHRKAKSIYGQIKFAGEVVFLAHNGGAVRAGIIFGEEVGGIYTTLKQVLSRAKLIPLPFRGHSRMFTTHVDDLCKELICMAESRQTEIVFGANPWPKSFRGLLFEIADNERQIKLIGIPCFLTNTFLTITKVLGLHIQIIDSLRSLQCQASAAELSEMVPSVTFFRKITASNEA